MSKDCARLYVFMCVCVCLCVHLVWTLKEKSGPGLIHFKRKSLICENISDRKVKIWCKSDKYIRKSWNV